MYPYLIWKQVWNLNLCLRNGKRARRSCILDNIAKLNVFIKEMTAIYIFFIEKQVQQDNGLFCRLTKGSGLSKETLL